MSMVCACLHPSLARLVLPARRRVVAMAHTVSANTGAEHVPGMVELQSGIKESVGNMDQTIRRASTTRVTWGCNAQRDLLSRTNSSYSRPSCTQCTQRDFFTSKTMKTHRWIFIVLVFLGGCFAGIAQGQAVTPPDQLLSKEFVPADRRFKIRFPDVPKEYDLSLDTKIGPIVSHNVMHTSNITYLLVYTDYPTTFEKAD